MDRAKVPGMLISIIVPVYNRPDEVCDLLRSLTDQTDRNFQIVIVEDGSTVRCKDQVDLYAEDRKSVV